jgi:DNA polymerase III alpha subunit
MYVDLKGKTRQKVELHTHTTRSDGGWTPEAVVRSYKELGFDAVALTDHWKYGESGEVDGITVISGGEYNIGGHASENGVYHIVGLFMDSAPAVSKQDSAQYIIDQIHSVGGLAVLAHPAWSLNTPEMIMQLRDVDATEIYNAVSEKGESFRPDSSLIVDMLAARGVDYPLLATDDAHYYNGVDNGLGYIMVEAETNSADEIRKAIEEKRFYATQGPEIHFYRDGDKFCVDCSPASHIYFASNQTWCRRATHGEGLTHAEYKPGSDDVFLRAFVVDADGKCAWSNIIKL